jgi:peptide/nickel transport system ATP-binding protein
MPEPQPAVVSVRNLVVELDSGGRIVDDVTLDVRHHEVLGILGESGSGKTTLALATLGRARPGARITEGRIEVHGQDIVSAAPAQARSMRGRVVSYVPQDPGGALNPSRRIGAAIAEVMRVHGGGATDTEVEATLARVHLPSDVAFQERFPHQLSGGQQQRVVIGMATAMTPPLVVFDEPTTGLDVVTQAYVLREIRRLLAESSMSAIYVSHDLAVIASLANRVAVMYAGRIIETGPTQEILQSPAHPYTASLIACTPDHHRATQLYPVKGVPPTVTERPEGCAFRPRCEYATDRCYATPPLTPAASATGRNVACFHQLRGLRPPRPLRAVAVPTNVQATPILSVSDLTARYRGRHGDMTAVREVSFDVSRGECLALVGESGSGKTTIGRCVMGLHAPASGQIRLAGESLSAGLQGRNSEDRRRIQFVFQSPYDSLNPQHLIGEQIARTGIVLRKLQRTRAIEEARAILQQVRLPERLSERYPHELSGGERQRVAIARALMATPEVLVCDEVTSALDVSVQAAVIDLLTDLQNELGLAMLFITHDLGVVASIANRVLVLESGEVREVGSVTDVLAHPKHPYTIRLLEAAPSLEDASHATTGATDEHPPNTS